MTDSPTDTPLGTDTPVNSTGTTSYQQLRFPSDLASHGHYIIFTAYQYKRDNRGNGVAHFGEKAGDIALPMPPSLSTGYRAEYDQNAELGFMGQNIYVPTVENAINLYKQANQTAKTQANVDVHKNALGMIDNLYGSLKDNIAGAIGYQALDMFENTRVGRAVRAVAGIARNPHLALLFQGVGFKQHQFQYNFIARNEQESTELLNIIKFFKSKMMPSLNQAFDNNLFNFPYEFDIKFSHPEFLYQIGTSVLADFSIDYHAQGQPMYFTLANGNKAPANISLSMQFIETTIVTQEGVDQDNR